MGRHRKSEPIRPGGRMAAVSVATGAILASGTSIGHASPLPVAAEGPALVSVPEILDLVRTTDLAGIAEQLGKTRQLEAERAALAYEAEKPRVMAPVSGTMTSNFGPRWGTTHYGLDIANSIGTPIVSATDGVVIESGPAVGFGLWVRIQQDDGTVGVYGHINEALVVAGQKVRAGELIATVGNRGQSTGPHLHYEVWQSDGQKTDPLAYLNSRGVSFGEKAASG
ncbi:M23 family metallopeptidase [Rhodococcus erythropolis]|nr:M23 family metallopeptidase [Rhodococcus erythropolis]EQM33660.1 peptidase M24 [Rhodococcus erythropolis DN1]MDJ0407630.1 M23 family metallopeptidase [Rhodococcus erythropolis]